MSRKIELDIENPASKFVVDRVDGLELSLDGGLISAFDMGQLNGLVSLFKNHFSQHYLYVSMSYHKKGQTQGKGLFEIENFFDFEGSLIDDYLILNFAHLFEYKDIQIVDDHDSLLPHQLNLSHISENLLFRMKGVRSNVFPHGVLLRYIQVKQSVKNRYPGVFDKPLFQKVAVLHSLANVTLTV